MSEQTPALATEEAPSVAPVTVRRATKEDFAGLSDLLCGQFHQEHMLGPVGFALNAEKAWAHILRTLDKGVSFVAVRGGEIVGSIGLIEEEPWWSSEKMVGDAWFYVAPNARASRAARELLKAAMAAAGAPLIIGVFNSTDLERKDFFFRRQGFIPLGCWYVKA